MQLNADQRVEYIQAIWAQFQKAHKVTRWHMTHVEYDLARKWAVRGIPLATVLQGINETSGKPKTLMACERSVEEQISRWAQAVGSLRELPAPGPLLESCPGCDPTEPAITCPLCRGSGVKTEPFDVEAARKRRDEALAAMRRTG